MIPNQMIPNQMIPNQTILNQITFPIYFCEENDGFLECFFL